MSGVVGAVAAELIIQSAISGLRLWNSFSQDIEALPDDALTTLTRQLAAEMQIASEARQAAIAAELLKRSTDQ
jgi:hypothetical protein